MERMERQYSRSRFRIRWSNALSLASLLAVTSLLVLQAQSSGRLSIEALSWLSNGHDMDVITPSSPLYRNASRSRNPLYDALHPAAVVFCESSSEVQSVVGLATKNNRSFVVRSGRHSLGGDSSVGGQGIIIDLSKINYVHLDANKQQAAVGGGAIMEDLNAALEADGFLYPPGTTGTVGVVGYLSGAGLPMIDEPVGCSSLLGAKVVLADGRLVVANATSHPDLFWALRGGGGGNFGVVVEVTLALIPLPPKVTFFVIVYPMERVHTVVKTYFEQAPTNPGSGLAMTLTAGPVIPPGPATGLVGVFKGDKAAAQTRLSSFLAIPNATLAEVFEGTLAEVSAKWTALDADRQVSLGSSYFLNSFAINEDMYKAISNPPFTPDFAVAEGMGLYCSLVGPATKPQHVAFAWNNASVICWIGASIVHPEHFKPSVEWFLETRKVFNDAILRPDATVGAYINYEAPYVSKAFSTRTDRNPDVAGLLKRYYGTSLPRLLEVKRAYDPDNKFAFHQGLSQLTTQ